MNKSKHLEEVIKTYQITREKALLDKHIQKKNEVKDALNLSISNHAKHLICATEQNRYEFVTTQFNGSVLEFDTEDLHNPTGCWSPIFKASYNDINTLVQFSIKHINLKMGQEKQP